MEDAILIEGLELTGRVGVPASERAEPQRLTITLRLEPARGLGGLGDEIGNTVDYAAVCEVVRAYAARGERKLIETLAEELAGLLLAGFPLRAVEIELRKYAVPGTCFTGIHLRRVVPL